MRGANALLLSIQQQKQEALLAEILPWLILLLGVVIAGGVAIYAIRRSLGPNASGSAADTGFTLHELRELHKKGEITDEQLARAKAAIIGTVQSRAARTHQDAQTDPSASGTARIEQVDDPESDNGESKQ